MQCQHETIGRQLYRTALLLRNYAEKVLSPFALTVEQFHLLKTIAQQNGQSQSQLCESLNKKPANITRILDRLERKSWVERQPNPEDRRSSTVVITSTGEQVIEEVASLFKSYSDRFIIGIGEEEERIFRQVLEKIQKNILDEIER